MGERLKERREHTGLTLGQVGAYEGVTAQYLSQLETGTRAPNVWSLLARLADRYRTSADYLLGLTDDPSSHRTLQVDPQFSETLTELHDIMANMSPDRQRAILAAARAMHEAELDERGPLDKMKERIARGDTDKPHIVGGED